MAIGPELLNRLTLGDRGDPNWEIRRQNGLRLIWWAMALVTFLVIFRDIEKSAVAIGTLVAFASSIYGIYVGATTWEDKDKRRQETERS